MFSKKRIIVSAVASIAFAGVGAFSTQFGTTAIQEVQASTWVNQYITNNNIKPVGIENREGTFNRWSGYRNGVGRPEGVMIHETATPNATAEAEVSYFNRNWPVLQTYVHAFVDANKIINIKNTDFLVWGAGPNANQRYIQVELCNVNTPDQFARSISNDAFYTASKLIQYGLPFVPDKTVVTHRQATNWWHDTTHVDPDGYLAKWGYDMGQFNELVGKYYNNLKSSGSVDGATAPQPELPSDGSVVKREGKVTVTNPHSFAVPLVAFREDGSTTDSNRGLAKESGWYTDQQRSFDGHVYYRVSTNEWVQDSYSSFVAL